MIINNINSPLTSSIGRLFDGVAGLLGFDKNITYEGDAAIYMERISDRKEEGYYNYIINNKDNKFIISTDKMIKLIINDIKNNTSFNIIAKRFHNTIVKFTCDMCLKIRENKGINKVALSGGVFINKLLLTQITNELRKLEFEVYSNKIIPTNDSGISVGQVVVAASRMEEEL